MFQPRFQVIDGLDESLPETRDEIVETLTAADFGARLLITSRYPGGFVGQRAKICNIDVSATKEDLKSYAQGCIERHTVLQMKWETLLEEDREEHLNRLTKSAAGMSVL